MPPLPIDPRTPTEEVARALLGAVLHRRLDDGTLLAGRIVETEAYLGLRDDACHSFHGRRTARVRSLYLPAGAAYVYLIYGIHLCLNVVTGDEQRPEAVLVRALAPLAGVGRMRLLRGQPAAGGPAGRGDGAGRHAARPTADHRLCDGPGKLCQAMAIGAGLDGHRLERPPLWIEAGPAVSDEEVAVSARVGLSPRLSSHAWPLRFHLRGDPHVSKARGLPEADGGPDENRTVPVRVRP